MPEITPCKVMDLGLTDYEEAWKLQGEIAESIAEGDHPACLMLVEHPPTYTFGRRGDLKNLLWNDEELQERGISTHWVDRGGDVTYHGPGQLIGYPLLSLGKPIDEGSHIPSADYVGYIRKLEECLILALMKLGVVAGQIPGLTGVWLQPDLASRCPRCKPEDRLKPAKIAAIGVKVDANGISRHGFALNVSPDMENWEGIIACGLVGHPVISLADILSPAPPMQTVKKAVLDSFAEIFRVRYI